MNIISVSYGNDSIALLQWAKEHGLENVYVVYVDTGWAHPGWQDRVKKGKELAEIYGFVTFEVKGPRLFAGWVKHKKMFPTNKYQWCTSYLKIIPFANFLDFIDPNASATIIVGKRRAESKKRESTQEFEFNNSFYSGQVVWNPLYNHTDAERDALILKTGFVPLPHRSLECCPCVNANRNDLRETPKICIDRVRSLEEKTGKFMYSISRYMGAEGIDEVISWANSSRGSFHRKQIKLFDYQCSSGMCG